MSSPIFPYFFMFISPYWSHVLENCPYTRLGAYSWKILKKDHQNSTNNYLNIAQKERFEFPIFPLLVNGFPAKNKSLLNPFVPNAPVVYPLKTSENLKVFWLWFSNVFRGYRKGTLGTNGLIFFQRQYSQPIFDLHYFWCLITKNNQTKWN